MAWFQLVLKVLGLNDVWKSKRTAQATSQPELFIWTFGRQVFGCPGQIKSFWGRKNDETEKRKAVSNAVDGGRVAAHPVLRICERG